MRRIGGGIDPGTMPPGKYLALPIELLIFSGTLQPVNDSNIEEFSVIQGPETRSGKIGKTRVTLLADPTTAGSDPLKLQWLVNGLPQGEEVTIPWTTTPAIPPTLADAFEVLKGMPYDFPNAIWAPGDFVFLQVTLGALISASQSLLTVTHEKNYAP